MPSMRTLAAAILVGITASAPGEGRADPFWGGADVSANGFAWRPVGDSRPSWQRGLALAWGPTVADDEGPVARFTGLVQFEVAMFDSRSYAVAVSTDAFEAAVRLGLLEPEIRAGFALATVDVIDGTWSGELFSPRAEVGLGVRVGRVRVSLGIQGEYFWRWFGPSILERGVVLDLRYEKPWRPRGQ